MFAWFISGIFIASKNIKIKYQIKCNEFIIRYLFPIASYYFKTNTYFLWGSKWVLNLRIQWLVCKLFDRLLERDSYCNTHQYIVLIFTGIYRVCNYFN